MQISEVELLGTPAPFTPGFLKFEAYQGIDGVNVSDLTNNAAFPASPSETRYLTAFDSRTAYADNSHESYGARISGYFVPNVSGNWIFYLRSDDGGQLFLNPTGDDPGGKILLTEETACCNLFSAHPSVPQFLAAGSRYYIEALYKEAGGGDYCQVAAKLATDPTPPDSLSPIPGSELAVLADPTGVNLAIHTQPADTIVMAQSAIYTANFNTTNGGFTAVTPQAYDGSWSYDASTGSWRQDGQSVELGRPATSFLNSPVLTVRSSAGLTLTFSHRYSFEFDGTRWDGGQLLVSHNGGPFSPVPAASFLQNGYGGNTVVQNSASILHGQPAFTAESPGYGSGYIITIADLGFFNAGDTVQFQFLAAGDTNTRGQVPNWQIGNASLMTLALPAAFTVNAAAAVPGQTNPSLVYLWERDCGGGMTLIPGAAEQLNQFNPGLADNGCAFRVRVSTPGALVTSRTAILTVIDPEFGFPRLTSPSNRPPSAVAINGNGQPGWNVAVQAAVDLVHWSWRTNMIPGTLGLFQFLENTPGSPTRFYRLNWAATMPRGLVSWWHADNNYLDSFAANEGGAFGSLPSFAPGQRGMAFQFDGTNQAILIPGSSIPVPWTATFWVNRQDATDISAALLADDATGLKLEQAVGTRRVGFTQFGVADYYFNYIVPTNTWTHLAFVASSAGTILYTNGFPAETHPATIRLPMTVLGARTTGQDHLQGLLDEVAVFNRAITPPEVRQVYNATHGP